MEIIDKIGKLIPANQTPERDAIHIAVYPVVAGEDIRVGSPVKFMVNSTSHVLEASYNKEKETIGIADPFIRNTYYITKGSKFFVFLNPKSVTSLRHHYYFDAVDKKKPIMDDHELWIREFAEKWNFDYDELIKEAQYTGGYATARGRDLHGASELEGEDKLFWYHLEKLTNKEFDEEHRSEFGWSCSC